MGGRFEKGFLNIQENYDDTNRIYGFEQNISHLSKDISKNINPLPDYNTVKQNLPSFSFPKADRFEEEKIYQLPGPNAYFRDHQEILEGGKNM
jgi:hypothetical protein